MSNITNTRQILPEWENQSGVIIAWPHKDTDWCYMLDEVEQCYVQIATKISEVEHLIVVTSDIKATKAMLPQNNNITFFEISTNDTWARDFGPITIKENGQLKLCDFGFNAWGNKFNWNLDNKVSHELKQLGAFSVDMIDYNSFILEGGSIETDGKGVLLTTSNCLLTPTRNPDLSKAQIEEKLKGIFGLKKVLWLDHGNLEGDDTDSHIDTLARLAPDSAILYVKCSNETDIHFQDFKMMESQLKEFTDADNKHFKLFPLPFPSPIFDEDNNRLPATYANYLVLNGRVIVPTYAQPDNDKTALDVVQQAFPNHEIVGVDCNALIKQHGSLHCITMQLPANILNK